MRIGVSIEELDGIWIAEVSDMQDLGGGILAALTGGKRETTHQRKAYPTQELMEMGVIEMIRATAVAIKEQEAEPKKRER